MKAKAILLGVIATTLLLSANSVLATPNWDITGTWNLDFELGGSHYLHTMQVTFFESTAGDFSGTGSYNPDNSYTWDVTGNVNGNVITFQIVYTGSNSGYTVTGTGTISSDGKSMSGTATGPGQGFTWTATGTATDNDGVENSQDLCPGTVADPTTMVLGTNRWIWTGSTWKTLPPKGNGPASLFADKTISDYTYGCSCEQILDYLHAIYPETYGNMVGQYKYGCSRSILEDWHNALYYIETVSVPANKDTPTSSVIPLQAGKNYELKTYGTACAEMNSPPTCTIFFDAEYAQNVNEATKQWVDGVEGYEGYGPNLLDLMVNGGFVDWGTYNSAHTYWLPVTGTGSTLSLQVYDIYYPNNAGNLNVDIYAKLF